MAAILELLAFAKWYLNTGKEMMQDKKPTHNKPKEHEEPFNIKHHSINTIL